MEHDEVGAQVEAQIEQIRDRARRRFWHFLLIYPAVGIAASTGADVIGSRSDLLEEFLTRVVVAAIFVSVVALVSRRAGRRTPQLMWGLSAAQRRTVNRDLRRGRPNSDPVLREVERRMAVRMRRAVDISVWLLPIVIVLGCSCFAIARDAGEDVLVVVFVTMAAGLWFLQLRLSRGLRAFVR